MFNWYKVVSPNEKKTFWACLGGWSLDALETQMYGLAIPALLIYFSITKAEAGLVASVTLITSAIGGWLAGAISDRYGRVKTLQIMILWFAVFTFFTAFVTNFHMLVVLKALQGFGIGGEWAAGAVLMAETIRSEHRGKVMATVQSGWAIGWLLAVIVFASVFYFAPENIAWRIMFAIGLAPTFLLIYIRRNLVEPEKVKKPADQQSNLLKSMLGIFKPSLLRTTILGGLLGLGAHGGYHAIMGWLPTFLKAERNLSVLSSSGYLVVIIVAFWCGCIASSILLDRIGRRKNVAFFAICCIISVQCYTFLPLTNTQMLFLGFPLGFFAAGIPSSLGALFNELYPQEIRGAGVGFCYNFGRILSSVFPFLVGYMSTYTSMSLGTVIGIDAGLAYALVVVTVLLLPETRGRDLNKISKDGTVTQ